MHKGNLHRVKREQSRSSPGALHTPSPPSHKRSAASAGHTSAGGAPTKMKAHPTLVKALARSAYGGVGGGSSSSSSGKGAGGTGNAYEERKNQGEERVLYNEPLAVEHAVRSSGGKKGQPRVQVAASVGDTNLEGRYRFMHTTLEQRGAALEDRLQQVKASLTESYGLEDWTPVGVPSQSPVLVCGRICCECGAGEGKERMNPASVWLEGDMEMSGGARTRLDLHETPSLALFPGQIVAVQGLAPNAERLVVKRIYSSQAHPMQTTARGELLEFGSHARYLKDGAMNIVVAQGPYTTTDNLEHQPLEDLLEAVRSADQVRGGVGECWCLVPCSHCAVFTLCDSFPTFMSTLVNA